MIHIARFLLLKMGKKMKFRVIFAIITQACQNCIELFNLPELFKEKKKKERENIKHKKSNIFSASKQRI